MPTPETAKHKRKKALQTELELIETTYPMPIMETLRVEYRPSCTTVWDPQDRAAGEQGT